MSRKSVTLTITNHLTANILSHVPVPEMDITTYLPTPAFLVNGSISANPQDIASETSVPNDGGIYGSGLNDDKVLGVCAYLMPGGVQILVIRFDGEKFLLGTKPKGTELNEAIVQEIAAGNKSTFDSAFVLGRKVYKYTAAVIKQGTEGSICKGEVTLWVTEMCSPEDSQIIMLSTRNWMTSDTVGYTRDPRFDLPVILPAADFMESGVVAAAPLDVPSMTMHGTNIGGIYVTRDIHVDVEGILGYALPDGTNIIVVYFASQNIFFKIKPVGTELNNEVLQEVAKSAQRSVSGLVTISRSEIYTITATSDHTATGSMMTGTITFECSPI